MYTVFYLLSLSRGSTINGRTKRYVAVAGTVGGSVACITTDGSITNGPVAAVGVRPWPHFRCRGTGCNPSSEFLPSFSNYPILFSLIAALWRRKSLQREVPDGNINSHRTMISEMTMPILRSVVMERM